MLWILSGIIGSYLIGSIPTGYIFGRALKGIDIRNHGSGNIGATNALRVLGKRTGICVLALDILKGFLPVMIFGAIIMEKTAFSAEQSLLPLALAAICGHIWTVFLNFNGGKGIATTLGALIGLAFKIPGLNNVLALLLLTWLLFFILTRMVSLASIISSLAMPVYMALYAQPKIILASGILLSLFSLYRHKGNMKRIIEGTEKKLSFGKSAHQSSSSNQS